MLNGRTVRNDIYNWFKNIFSVRSLTPEGERACPKEPKASRLDSEWIQIDKMAFRNGVVREAGWFDEF